jgi:hypothetical protein
MNTTELLVYVLVFLIGCMLFKRCGCRSVEGIETINQITIPIHEDCVINNSISNFIDVNKINAFNRGEFITLKQCEEINSLQPGGDRANENPLRKCAELGSNMLSFNNNDISNTTTCENLWNMEDQPSHE